MDWHPRPVKRLTVSHRWDFNWSPRSTSPRFSSVDWTTVAALEDEEEYERHDSVHLAYVEKVGMISQAAKDYFRRWRGNICHQRAGWNRRRTLDFLIWSQSSSRSTRSIPVKSRWSSWMRWVSRLQQPNTPLEDDWMRRQRKLILLKVLARWLDGPICSRPSETWCRNHSSRSSVKTGLKPYIGRSLEWFEWIDLFRALVHDTGKFLGEKLAILKRHFKGADLVPGLGEVRMPKLKP
jgi:hypothetical protein